MIEVRRWSRTGTKVFDTPEAALEYIANTYEGVYLHNENGQNGLFDSDTDTLLLDTNRYFSAADIEEALYAVTSDFRVTDFDED